MQPANLSAADAAALDNVLGDELRRRLSPEQRLQAEWEWRSGDRDLVDVAASEARVDLFDKGNPDLFEKTLADLQAFGLKAKLAPEVDF